MSKTLDSYWSLPIIEGHGLRLEPLALRHELGLRTAAADGELWNLRVTSVPEPDNTAKYINDALQMHSERKRVPFAVIEASTGRVLGSTSYHDLIPEAKRLEIGYTWYANSVQRSNVNTSCKLLLMQRAFDVLGAELVGWRTDILNARSQRAIERLGAKREGILRSHALRRDGSVRDTVIYGMPRADWPTAQARLLASLGKPPAVLDFSQVRIQAFAELDEQTARSLVQLSPGALGERMVAPNGVSLSQSLSNPHAVLRAAVWQREGDRREPLGLSMLSDATLPGSRAGHAANEIYLWRLMVGFAHHGKGVGELLVQDAVAYARSRGARWLKTSHVPTEGHAGGFYLRQGFAYTGEQDGDEVVMSLTV